MCPSHLFLLGRLWGPGCRRLHQEQMDKYLPPHRFRRAESPGPGPPVGVLLAGGADDRPDVEVSGPPREADLLP